RPTRLHRADPRAAPFVRDPAHRLATLDRPAAGLFGRHAGGVLDDSTHRVAVRRGGAAMTTHRSAPRSRTRFPCGSGRSAFRLASRHRAVVICSIAAVTAPDAFAHLQTGEAAGFLSGFAHPISGLDHVAAMVAVGLWGAQLGAPALWVLPVAFPLVMAFGGFLGFVGVPLPSTEVGIAASAIVLGAAVVFEWKPPLAGAAAVVAVFGVFHGYAHGTELRPGENAALYSMGFVIATGCLHACGIAVGTMHRWRTGANALRGLGAAIAAAGGFFLWRALA